MEQETLFNILSGGYGEILETHAMWQCIAALGVRPFKDGNQWCFLYGSNIQEGICGFGDTIFKAAWDFYTNIKTEEVMKEGSKDERIRKWLYERIDRTSYDNLTEKERTKNEEWKKKVLAWLEKQKEQKPASKPKVYDSMDDLIADVLIEEIEASELPESAKYNRTYWVNKHRQKPAEWSEEDERIRQCLIRSCEKELDDLRNDKYGHQEIVSDLKECYRERINWLKSLRPQPHWKPSEEQMEALKYSLGNGGKFDKAALESLYNDLLKLIV